MRPFLRLKFFEEPLLGFAPLVLTEIPLGDLTSFPPDERCSIFFLGAMLRSGSGSFGACLDLEGDKLMVSCRVDGKGDCSSSLVEESLTDLLLDSGVTFTGCVLFTSPAILSPSSRSLPSSTPWSLRSVGLPCKDASGSYTDAMSEVGVILRRFLRSWLGSTSTSSC